MQKSCLIYLFDPIKNLRVSCVRCSFAYVLDIFLYEANSKRATLQTTM